MSSPTTDYKFQGWLGHDAMSNKGNLIWGDFEPKAWEETDIDIKITHSGICGSDLHTLRSGWVSTTLLFCREANAPDIFHQGPTDYPVCVGHEIVGFAVRVGSKVESGIKIGDRVGVGAQSDSCLGRLREKCDACLTDQEQYCPHAFVATYASKHLNGDKSYGGYATYNRSPSHFVFKIPDALPSEAAAPMLCAGITTYSPLRHYGAGPGKSVGVVGLGGLGHFAVLWARALGADSVVAISRKASKRQEALALGADSYIATSDAADWVSENRRSLDIVISTLSSSQVRGNFRVHSLLKVSTDFMSRYP